jgi:hypothetical protein
VGEVEAYIEAKLRAMLAERLAEAPWLCVLCGASGNGYERGDDAYWVPPDDHVCPMLTPPAA